MDQNKKPILVLVNPHSGRGKSLKIFKKYISTMLNSRGIKYDSFVTTTGMRVRQYLMAKNLDDLLQYQAIMVIGGDGLLYETVNAIMARSDWEQVMNIPIGVIPSGSGNGLAYTLVNSLQAPVSCQVDAIKLCCEQIIRAEKRPCDLVRLRYGKDNITIWSFLSIGWGLLADIDIDSEWLRLLGEFRFTIYGLLRSLTSVSYRGKLSIKLLQNDETFHQSHISVPNDTKTSQHDAEKSYSEDEESLKIPKDTNDEWIHIEGKFACLYAVHQSYVNSATKFSPNSSLTDKLTYLTYIRGTLNTYQVIEFLLAIADGSHTKLSYVTVVPVQSFEFQPLQSSKIVVDGEVIPWNVEDGPIRAEVVPEALYIAWPAQGESKREQPRSSMPIGNFR